MSFLRQALKRAAGSEIGNHTVTRLLAAALGLAALGSSAWAQTSLTLAWGASSDPTVLGYRFYLGGASGLYTNVVDVGSATSNTVAPLTVGATYFFAVTAYDSVGLESSFSNEISYTVPSTNLPPPLSVLSLAADSGALTAPFIASNGILWQTVQSVLPSGGQAVYAFTITNAGNYTLSAAVNAPKQGTNSFYVNLDAQPTDPVMIWDIQPLTTGFMNRTLSWRGNGTATAPQYAPKVFNLSAGVHQLIVRGRAAYAQLGTLTIAPYLVITNIAQLSTGNRTITGSGVANATCVLYAASSLAPPVAWAPIATNAFNSQGLFACNDLAATNFVRRFYHIQGR